MNSISKILHQTWWSLRRSGGTFAFLFGLVLLYWWFPKISADFRSVWIVKSIALVSLLFLTNLILLEKLMESHLNWTRAFWRTRPITWPQMMVSGIVLSLCFSLPFCLLWTVQVHQFPGNSAFWGNVGIAVVFVLVSVIAGAVGSLGNRRIDMIWITPICWLIGSLIAILISFFGYWITLPVVAILLLIWSLRFAGKMRFDSKAPAMICTVVLIVVGFISFVID